MTTIISITTLAKRDTIMGLDCHTVTKGIIVKNRISVSHKLLKNNGIT